MTREEQKARTRFRQMCLKTLDRIKREGQLAPAILSRDARNARLVARRTERAADELKRRNVSPQKQQLVLEDFKIALNFSVSSSRRGLPVQTRTGNIRSVNIVGDVLTFDIVEALKEAGIPIGRGRKGGLASALDGIARGVPADRRRLQRAKLVSRV